jgi:chromosome segregation ATPase
LSTDRSTRAGTPGSDRVVDELARLRRRVNAQDHALARLSEALQALRTGSQALRDENRELRRQLELRPGAERCPPA